MDVCTNVDQDVQKPTFGIYTIQDEYVNYPDDEIQAASTIIDVSNGRCYSTRLAIFNAVSFGINQAVKLTVTGVLP